MPTPLLLRSLRLHARSTTIRIASTATRLSSTFDQSPSPPRLPPDQQAEFERLLRAAEARSGSATATATTTATATATATSPSPSQPQPATLSPRHTTTPSTPDAAAAAAQQAGQQGSAKQAAQDSVSPGSLSGGVRRGAAPEFEGDVNPKTGEVGGPKNEPLRWGGEGDWSYNGRVTDF